MLTRNHKMFSFVLASVLAALIIAMSIVPYTGYINYGLIEITTLHIITILGGVCLGWKYGAVLGAVWGLSCIVRCYVLVPAMATFGFANFFVAGLPRIMVGLVAGLVFVGVSRWNKAVGAVAAALAGTLTNTVLVLTAMNFYAKFFHPENATDSYTVFKNILGTLVGVNGLIELAAALVVVPLLYRVVSKLRVN